MNLIKLKGVDLNKSKPIKLSGLKAHILSKQTHFKAQ